MQGQARFPPVTGLAPVYKLEFIDGWSLAQERSLRGGLPPAEVVAIA